MNKDKQSESQSDQLNKKQWTNHEKKIKNFKNFRNTMKKCSYCNKISHFEKNCWEKDSFKHLQKFTDQSNLNFKLNSIVSNKNWQSEKSTQIQTMRACIIIKIVRKKIKNIQLNNWVLNLTVTYFFSADKTQFESLDVDTAEEKISMMNDDIIKSDK